MQSLEIHFIYLGNKEMYCIFKTYCIISVLFSTEYHSFHDFSYSGSSIMFLYTMPKNLSTNPVI